MKNSSTLLALVILLVASFLALVSTIPAYSEGEGSSQQTEAQAFVSWPWIILIFIIAVLAGALLIFMMAFLQRRRRKQQENQRAVRIHLVR